MSTGISYLDESISPIAMRCSFAACPCRADCWHLKMADRLAGNKNLVKHLREAYEGGPPVLCRDRLAKILRMEKGRRIGIQFMGDLFDHQILDEFAMTVFDCLRQASLHSYFLLTKQASRMVDFAEKHYARYMPFLSDVYWGASIIDQTNADRMIPELLEIPGKKWISYEPALDKVWFGPDLYQFSWLVVGGHNSPARYPCKLEWVESAVDEARSAGIPVYVKQIHVDGKLVHDINNFPDNLRIREWPNG